VVRVPKDLGQYDAVIDERDVLHIPSEFSMMRGDFPSITATAEFVVPRSIPMTEPLTFSLESSAYLRTKDEARGDLKAAAGARKLEAARGRKVRDNLEGNILAVV
jgi:hypothetical protein